MEPIFINEASLAALASTSSSSSSILTTSPNVSTPSSSSTSASTPTILSSSSSSLSTGSSVSQVNVHPVVLFSILDQYIRRESPGDKVIGALLGTVNNGVIEVTNSFGIYHKATQEEILIRRQTLYDMLELHKRIEPKEILVGWYSTWKEHRGASSMEERLNSQQGGGASEHIDQFSLVVQDFFAEAAGGKFTPFHMLVDVSLTSPHLKIYAYKPITNHIIKNVIIQFARLKVQVIASTEERVALDTMARSGRLSANVASVGGHGPVPVTGEAKDVAPELDSLVSSLQRLLRLLDTVTAYVDDVVSGKRESDEALGRQIADALSAIPSLSMDRFRGSLDTTIKDTLMVTYLSQLATVHLKIAERISQLPAF